MPLLRMLLSSPRSGPFGAFPDVGLRSSLVSIQKPPCKLWQVAGSQSWPGGTPPLASAPDRVPPQRDAESQSGKTLVIEEREDVSPLMQRREGSVMPLQAPLGGASCAFMRRLEGHGRPHTRPQEQPGQ